ncbi:glycosyltransferase family 2 protein [Ekhidna sp.]|uniref:glycosyltransferase family 2 protein n=1 Tax=Ekhidna sp. TaxID=2608089 RepID=UPI00329A11D9
MAKTAVVILNYNGKGYLEKFLPSVINHSAAAEIIIADNASTDDSLSFLSTQYPDIRQIVLKKNLGYAGGYNEALKQIDSDFFVLLNSDVEVTSGWLDPMESFLNANSSYAACQPKIKDFTHQSLFEYAGACGGYIDSLGYPFCRGRIFDELEIDSGQYNNPEDIFWASGACLMIRKTAFEKVGGFDADFFAHMEEIDLCWRLHSIDLKVKSIPSSVVYHVGGGTLDKSSTFKTYLNFRNGLFLLIKNLPLGKLIYKLPIRVALDWVAVLKFILEGKVKHGLAVLKAHLSAFLRMPRMYGKRRKLYNPPDSRSIILSFFLRNKRKFSDL